jgi:murein peptide amidase A
MSILTQTRSTPAQPVARYRRSTAKLLAPLNRMAVASSNLLVQTVGTFIQDGETYELPRYVFVGPKGGDEPIRIGLFAGIHGDEPAGSYALVQFLSLLDRFPELAKGYCLFAYPVCNPTGFEDNTRYSRGGRDLNREFWQRSNEPEVRLLEQELRTHSLHGIVSLHADDTSHGLYGFAHGATLTKHLIEPALKAAEEFLPRNHENIIDGFNARRGIIRKGYQGILSAPPKNRPRPFEIILETPHAAPQYRQEKALVVALQEILNEYRKMVAYAPNL